MDRRRFLKFSTAAILANYFTAVSQETPVSNKKENPTVWKVEGISEESVKKLFSALGGIEKLISGDLSRATVLIKPNICLPHQSSSGTITSYEPIETFCQVLISYGIKKIIIADHTLQKSEYFKDIELFQLEKKYPEVKILLADKERMYQPIKASGKVLKKVEALKLLKRVELFINFATAKHHSATQVSLAIKNLMGVIWNRSDFHIKMDLHQAIADLALTIRPDLNIIDASRILLNGGPTGPGKVVTGNRLYAAYDILALDSIVASEYNFGGKSLSAKEIPHLWAAYQNGLGEIDINKIKLVDVKG